MTLHCSVPEHQDTINCICNLPRRVLIVYRDHEASKIGRTMVFASVIPTFGRAFDTIQSYAMNKQGKVMVNRPVSESQYQAHKDDDLHLQAVSRSRWLDLVTLGDELSDKIMIDDEHLLPWE